MTAGSDGGISDRGVHIPTTTGAVEFKIKNPDFRSVFRSELVVIKRGL